LEEKKEQYIQYSQLQVLWATRHTRQAKINLKS
jgi:hypothetical protein